MYLIITLNFVQYENNEWQKSKHIFNMLSQMLLSSKNLSCKIVQLGFLKESRYITRTDSCAKFPHSSSLSGLSSCHLLMADHTQRPQVVNVTLSTTLPDWNYMVHMPKLK